MTNFIIDQRGWKIKIAAVVLILGAGVGGYFFAAPSKTEASQPALGGQETVVTTPVLVSQKTIAAQPTKQIVFASLEDQEAAINLLTEAIQKGWTGNIKNYQGALTDATLFKVLFDQIDINIPLDEKPVMMKRVEQVIVLEDAEIVDVLGASDNAGTQKVEVVKNVLKDFKTKGQIITAVKNAPLVDN